MTSDYEKKSLTNEYLYRWLMLKTYDNVSLADYLINRGIRSIALYGYTQLSRVLLAEVHDKGINIPYLIDKRASSLSIRIKVFTVEEINKDLNNSVDVVIVCIPNCDDEFVKYAKQYIEVPLISFEEVIYEL